MPCSAATLASSRIGALGVVRETNPRKLFAASDVVVDFTAPGRRPRIRGGGGREETAGDRHHRPGAGARGGDRRAARTIAIVRAPNMSLGVNLLLGLVARRPRCWATSTHRDRRDASSPQGRCALGHGAGLGREAAAARGMISRQEPAGARRHHRPRRRGDIGFAALRGGDVAGDHMVISLATASDRAYPPRREPAIFARGGPRGALAVGKRGALRDEGRAGARLTGLARPSWPVGAERVDTHASQRGFRATQT